MAVVLVPAAMSAPQAAATPAASVRASKSTFVGVVTSSFPVDYSALPLLYPDEWKKLNYRLGVLSAGGGSDVIRTLISGDQNVHFAVTSIAGAIQAQAAGADIWVIAGDADGTTGYAWVAKAGSDVRTINDLAGKTIAFTGPGSSTQTLADLCTTKAGIQNVKFRATGGIGNGLSAVASGGVDAAPVVEPTLSSLMAQNPRPYQVVFRGTQCTDAYQSAVLVVRKEFARQYPKRVKAFLRGWQLALNAIQKNPTEASRRWTEALNIDNAQLAVPFINQAIVKNRDLKLALSLDGVRVVVQKGLPALNVKGPVQWGRLINQGFLPRGTPRIKLTQIGQPPS